MTPENRAEQMISLAIWPVREEQRQEVEFWVKDEVMPNLRPSRHPVYADTEFVHYLEGSGVRALEIELIRWGRDYGDTRSPQIADRFMLIITKSGAAVWYGQNRLEGFPAGFLSREKGKSHEPFDFWFLDIDKTQNMSVRQDRENRLISYQRRRLAWNILWLRALPFLDRKALDKAYICHSQSAFYSFYSWLVLYPKALQLCNVAPTIALLLWDRICGSGPKDVYFPHSFAKETLDLPLSSILQSTLPMEEKPNPGLMVWAQKSMSSSGYWLAWSRRSGAVSGLQDANLSPDLLRHLRTRLAWQWLEILAIHNYPNNILGPALEAYLRNPSQARQFSYDPDGKLNLNLFDAITRGLRDYLVHGRRANLPKSFSRLINLSLRWHQQFALAVPVGPTGFTLNIPPEVLLKPFPEPVQKIIEVSEEYDLAFIGNITELQEEGERMHHCVVTRWEQCLSGQTLIYSLRRSQGPSERLATVAIDPGGQVLEMRGPSNSLLKREVEREVQLALESVFVANATC